MKFLIKVLVEAKDQAEADQLHCEMSGAIERARVTSKIGDGLTFEVREPIELETDRVKEVTAAALEHHLYVARGPDDINIDPDAILSEGEDGPWIQAWLFVPKELVGGDPEEEGDVDD